MLAYVTLLRRELGAYFASLTGYVIISAASFLMGLSFVVILMQLRFEPTPMPATELFFMTPFFWVILLLAAPVITMRLFALEKYSGTFETLMTAPVRDVDVVLAKFSAALIFYMVMWAPLLACMTIVRRYTDDPTILDSGTIIATYLGILLLGCVFISIGCLSSAVTRSQTVAAMISLVFGTALFMASFLGDQFQTIMSWQREILAGFALFDQMHDFARGVIDSRAVVFHVSLTFLFLFVTLRVVESRRWR
jgi:ABC-2 type transport system permease protein